MQQAANQRQLELAKAANVEKLVNVSFLFRYKALYAFLSFWSLKTSESYS